MPKPFPKIGCVGKRVGLLTILSEPTRNESGHLSVFCRCDCGRELTRDWKSLHVKTKYPKSCSCAETYGEIGKKYGELTVLGIIPRQGMVRTKCSCRCDCGTTVVVHLASFRGPDPPQHCGCRRRMSYGMAAFRKLFRTYIAAAARRGCEWNLTGIEVYRLFKLSCVYCGIPPCQIYSARKSYGKFIYNGIDRVDSTRGYSTDNVVPCCGDCNRLKSSIPLDKFYATMAKIVRHHPEILTLHEVKPDKIVA